MEFRDFDIDEKYFWMVNEDGKKISNQREQYIVDGKFIVDIPRLFLKIYQKNKFNLKEFLKVYYVTFVKYENEKYYKIVTKHETIIINKETLLPEYSCKNWVSTEEDKMCEMEYFYEFEINTVTDEEMKKT